MKPIYVAGPVIRRWHTEPEVSAIYETLTREAEDLNLQLQLPYSEQELERMAPREFVEEIRNRLDTVDSVVAVYHDRDPSAAGESAIAALAGKRILIVSKNPTSVPRILRGLPGVIDVVGTTDLGRLRNGLLSLGEGDTAPARTPEPALV
jgi:hypothetical protein